MGMSVARARARAERGSTSRPTQVQPALQSYWLVLHVGVAITATGIFTVAFAASVLQVLKSYREEGSPPTSPR